MLNKLLFCSCKRFIAAVVETIAAAHKRNSYAVARAVQHIDLVGVFFIPQDIPAVDLIAYLVFIIENTYRAPHIGNAVSAAHIIGHIKILFIDIIDIGDIAVVKLRKQIQRYKTLHRIIRRKEQIVICAGSLKLCKHTFIIGKIAHPDRTAVFLFKLLKNGLIHVIVPVIKPENGLAFAAAHGKKPD